MLMSGAMHFVVKNVPGYGPSDIRCLPCSGVSGRVNTVSPNLTGKYRLHSQIKIGSLKYTSREASFVCQMSSGGYKRNSEFSRQNRNGYSRSRIRKSEERESYEKQEEFDPLSSRNGSTFSLSNTPKFQATAMPGPREKEIVELFRKVQVQLRERTAIKEENKIEALQGKKKENETVDSLLKLLRKHSVQQGNRRSNEDVSKNFTLDQPEGPGKADTDTSIFDSDSTVVHDIQESTRSSVARPSSNFRRRSPVPQMKLQVDNSSEETVNSTSISNLGVNGKKNLVDTSPEPKIKPEPEPEPESNPKPEGNFADVEVYDDTSEEEDIDESECKEKEESIEDFSTLKLPELRVLAKSRGIKGFSKMKKGELVELLSGRLT